MIQEGIYDQRNRVNDLTGKEWLQLSKSVWVSERCAEDKEAFKHPAPFLIKDIRKLIKLFTKKRMIVLDPFNGSGTTLIASSLEKRKSIGIDLNKKLLISYTSPANTSFSFSTIILFY